MAAERVSDRGHDNFADTSLQRRQRQRQRQQQQQQQQSQQQPSTGAAASNAQASRTSQRALRSASARQLVSSSTSAPSPSASSRAASFGDKEIEPRSSSHPRSKRIKSVNRVHARPADPAVLDSIIGSFSDLPSSPTSLPSRKPADERYAAAENMRRADSLGSAAAVPPVIARSPSAVAEMEHPDLMAMGGAAEEDEMTDVAPSPSIRTSPGVGLVPIQCWVACEEHGGLAGETAAEIDRFARELVEQSRTGKGAGEQQ